MGFLDSMITGGGGRGFQRGIGGMGGMGMSPMTTALLGLLAYRTFKGKGRLSEMTGIGRDDGIRSPNAAQDMGSPLGGMLTGSTLAGGLADLLQRFQGTPFGDKAESWVQKGANKEIAPQELAGALGEERIEWLMTQTGLSRVELLDGLSKKLPETIDQLTPEGRLPSGEEVQKLL